MKKYCLQCGSVFFSEKKNWGENQKEDEIPIISEKQSSFAMFLSRSFSLFSPFIFLRKEHFRELAEAATGFVGRWK